MDEQGRTTVGVLHPGAMGAAVAGVIVEAGHQVLWTSEDRSQATVERAEHLGLEDVHWLNGVVNQSDIIISICPPHAALEVAEDVRNMGYQGVYVDANAVSPETTRRVGKIVESVGAMFVDGGIIGGPPVDAQAGTRLFLSGPEAARVTHVFGDGPLRVEVLDGPVGAASALKMAYAAWTKGTSALLASVMALAVHEGVLEPLQAQWDPALLKRAEGLGGAAAKAWRWAGEMEEIAASFQAAALPDGFHLAAAEVYRRLEQFKDDPQAPGRADLARHLLAGQPDA